MHTMSDQIGDNDDFDRDSRTQLFQNELTRQKLQQKYKQQSDQNQVEKDEANDEDVQDMIVKGGGGFNGAQNPVVMAYTKQVYESEMKLIRDQKEKQPLTTEEGAEIRQPAQF